MSEGEAPGATPGRPVDPRAGEVRDVHDVHDERDERDEHDERDARDVRDGYDVPDVPDAVVGPRRGPSIVWLVPLLAAAIGVWLWYVAEHEKGPQITIALHTAEDIETGRTRVKFRNVDLGEVQRIDFADDLSGVVVTVQMNRRATPYLRDGARFWVVRPRIGARGISGLGTLVSGAYIEMEPSISGQPRRSFTGLEEPPVAPNDAPGLKLQLHAEDLGAVDVGSGVFFKGIQVGQVESHRLAVDSHSVDVTVYIEPQFAPLIHRGTRFWNASGIDVTLGTDGVQASMQSLEALFRGGIACETPRDADAGEPAHSGDTFTLHANRAASQEGKTDDGLTVVMFFSGSVRGLALGAPVEFRGIRVGSVKDFWLEFDADTHETRIPVLATIQSGVGRRVDSGARDTPEQDLQGLIARGLRARLATGSLLTGALFVDVDMFPGTPATLVGGGGRIEVPTIPSTSETLAHALTQVTEVVAELHSMVQHVEQATPTLLAGVEQASVSVQTALAQATLTMQRLQALADEGGALSGPLRDALAELARSLRSVRELVDMLERHPEALIRGKPDGDR